MVTVADEDWEQRIAEAWASFGSRDEQASGKRSPSR
jgi:hypothetical protein